MADLPYIPNANPDKSSTGNFEFGNGQPLNLSAREYPLSRDERRKERMPTQLQPELPTEFQTFVAGSLGKMLPIYGAQLFEGAMPSTFAPLDRVPVTADYVLGPGDELLLRAWGGITFYLRETVDRAGNIYIPHVGLIQIANIRFADAKEYLNAQISRVFRRFDLSVQMGQLRSIQVLVVGNTRRPGSYTISSLSTLASALFICGGPSRAGTMRSIEVRRGSSPIAHLDLYRLLLEGDKSQDIRLLPGDVIYFPAAGPRVAISGSVALPAIYELRSGENLGDLLKMAGGLTSLASTGSGELERIDERSARHIQDLQLDEAGLRTPMKDGDVLRVVSIVPRFNNAITLRGNVANPGRYAWSAGMRIRDLIPNKEALLTREYWRRHNDLSLGSLPQQSAVTERSAPDLAADRRSRPAQTTPPVRLSETGGTGTGLLEDEELDGTAFGRGERNGVHPEEIGDGSTPNSLGVSGRSIASASDRPSTRFPRANRVELSVPEIDWDYAVIERLNADDLTTSLKPFALGRVVLQKDDRENFELKPGDVITVFSQADIRVPQTRQLKLVRLEGEFEQAGVYSLQPGETLRDLVKRAGGLTPQAYLFGSSFTRASTREQQQTRLDEYASNLEQDIDRAGANRSNAVVNVQEASVISAGLESQRALAGKLRKMRSTGRIVLDIAPGSNATSSIPEIPLEDGDTFVVPASPFYVAVVGAVYDQNSFVFENKRRAGDYLQLAGGVTKNGDTRHAFIIRADGSVVSRHSKLAHARNGLEHLAMNPGDTVVVPEVINRTTLLRGLTDWSAVFSQFALGAAAINILH